MFRKCFLETQYPQIKFQLCYSLACDLDEVICIGAFISSSVKWRQYPVHQSQGVYKRLNDFCKELDTFSAIKIVNGKGLVASLLCMSTQNLNTTLTLGAFSVRNDIKTQLHCINMFRS